MYILLIIPAFFVLAILNAFYEKAASRFEEDSVVQSAITSSGDRFHSRGSQKDVSEIVFPSGNALGESPETRSHPENQFGRAKFRVSGWKRRFAFPSDRNSTENSENLRVPSNF
ncbi:MAG: hypothetical protein JWM68_3035 [Verrucomicrobiales bacterium]|nr:hypothetical protein [Verrucomicrobiales bacterium]